MMAEEVAPQPARTPPPARISSKRDKEPREDSDSESDDDDERAELLRQITAYHRHFPEVLTKKATTAAAGVKKTVAATYSSATPTQKLKDDLKELKNQVGGAGVVKDLSSLFVTMAYVMQGMGSFVGLKLEGPKVSLADIVNENRASFAAVSKELICKYDLESVGEPEVRLGMLAAQCLMVVHMKNTTELTSQDEARSSAAKTPEDASAAPASDPPAESRPNTYRE